MLLFTASVVVAQKPDYITKGDEAMDKLDYSSAKIWYEEGVSLCNQHCIEQLTSIWLLDNTLRSTMGRVMARCFSCMEDNATNYRDTTSMNLLILYYTDGIGTSEDPSRAEYWKKRVEEIRNPIQVSGERYRTNPPREKVKMNFFAGYSSTWEAPFGLTVGGVGRSVGWYLRFRSTLSFQEYSYECNKTFEISEMRDKFYTNSADKKNRKVNTLTGTGGIVIKVAPSFYISAGAGYCNSEILYKFDEVNDTADLVGKFWAKYDGKASGIVLDLDGTFKFGKFYGSLGCSMLNHPFLKDIPAKAGISISANAGIGVFF